MDIFSPSATIQLPPAGLSNIKQKILPSMIVVDASSDTNAASPQLPPPPRLYTKVTKRSAQAQKAIKRAHFSKLVTTIKKRIEFAKFKVDHNFVNLNFDQVKDIVLQVNDSSRPPTTSRNGFNSPPALTEQSPSPTLSTMTLTSTTNTAAAAAAAAQNTSTLLTSPPFNDFRTPLASPEPSFYKLVPPSTSLSRQITLRAPLVHPSRSRCNSENYSNITTSSVANVPQRQADGKLLQAWSSDHFNPTFPTPETSPTRIVQNQQQQQQNVILANRTIRSRQDDEEGAMMLLQMAGGI